MPVYCEQVKRGQKPFERERITDSGEVQFIPSLDGLWRRESVQWTVLRRGGQGGVKTRKCKSVSPSVLRTSSPNWGRNTICLLITTEYTSFPLLNKTGTPAPDGEGWEGVKTRKCMFFSPSVLRTSSPNWGRNTTCLLITTEYT